MTGFLHSDRFRWAVEGVLGLAIIVVLVRGVMTLTAAPDLTLPSAAAFARPDVSILTRFDPFQSGAAVQAAQGGAGEWTLHGVRAGGGNFDSAIIAGADGRQSLYRVGEAVAPGVILAEVGADHVRLSRGGAMVRLGFPEAAGAVAATEAPVAAAVASTPVSPERFAAEAALTPRLRDGRANGYVLQPRGRGETLSAAGLQAGDVILSVNGMAMNAERVADLAIELGAGETARIEYERAGRRHEVELRTREPSSR